MSIPNTFTTNDLSYCYTQFQQLFPLKKLLLKPIKSDFLNLYLKIRSNSLHYIEHGYKRRYICIYLNDEWNREDAITPNIMKNDMATIFSRYIKYALRIIQTKSNQNFNHYTLHIIWTAQGAVTTQIPL